LRSALTSIPSAARRRAAGRASTKPNQGFEEKLAWKRPFSCREASQSAPTIGAAFRRMAANPQKIAIQTRGCGAGECDEFPRPTERGATRKVILLDPAIVAV
jgi:hypothetical protein